MVFEIIKLRGIFKNCMDNLIYIKFKNNVRILLDMIVYVVWIIFDFSKFKIIKTSKIKNLLVVYSGAMGDNFNAIGLMNNLKNKYPDVEIYYLTDSKSRKLIQSPKINLICLDQAEEMTGNKEIDACVHLQGSNLKDDIFSNKLYFNLLKVPYRSGCHEVPIRPDLFFKFISRPLLLTRKVFTVNSNGFSDQQKAFENLGFKVKPEFYYTCESEKFAINFLKKNKISNDDNIIFLHPGAGTIMKAIKEGKVPSHLWSSKRWALLIDELKKRYNSKIIFTGVGEEIKIIEEIISQVNEEKDIFISAGKTKSIEDVASLIRKGKLLITIDTGMAHIGAQTKIPEIILFSSVHPKIVLPIGENIIAVFHEDKAHLCRRYACEICYQKHMGSISVEEILGYADKLINKKEEENKKD